jgi:hypothetical protein
MAAPAAGEYQSITLPGNRVVERSATDRPAIAASEYQTPANNHRQSRISAGELLEAALG